ncbi:hypothetical protein [Streptomyces luteogriseus]|uniref:hypothetical protein n=1 Tax=Streptomyces luteogriseus TaxID=68233 RepID=UPI002E36F1C8|nr:hypothetical protein [Streptomyces luteogriseus]WTJ29101.1 hypothetical protein OID52_19580 [Streptomyces luteogriseus]
MGRGAQFRGGLLVDAAEFEFSAAAGPNSPSSPWWRVISALTAVLASLTSRSGGCWPKIRHLFDG